MQSALKRHGERPQARAAARSLGAPLSSGLHECLKQQQPARRMGNHVLPPEAELHLALQVHMRGCSGNEAKRCVLFGNACAPSCLMGRWHLRWYHTCRA